MSGPFYKKGPDTFSACLSYFRPYVTNAVREGFNSRIQSIRSAARGFRTWEIAAENLSTPTSVREVVARAGDSSIFKPATAP
ncbi:MAG: transposase [Planctomycetota bacterium]